MARWMTVLAALGLGGCVNNIALDELQKCITGNGHTTTNAPYCYLFISNGLLKTVNANNVFRLF